MEMKYISLILGIFLIGIISAQTIYSGSSVYYPLVDSENQVITSLNYSIVNNTYNLEGLNVSWNSTGLILSIVPNYKPDNFSILINYSGYSFTPKQVIIYGNGYPVYINKTVNNTIYEVIPINHTINNTIYVPENKTGISINIPPRNPIDWTADGITFALLMGFIAILIITKRKKVKKK